ncbi:MAG TPA: YceI family protein [Fulvivirga sp.]|nr:YceI family protein [Fulvivirga sp.]
MKNLKFFGLLSFSILIAACGSKHEGADAVVSEAKAVDNVVGSKAFTIDTKVSQITWIGSKPSGKHHGIIPIKEGTISIEDNNIVGGSIKMDINGIKNLDLVNNEEMQAKLINHLKSVDFFDAANYPFAEFTITSVDLFSPDEAIKIKEEYESENKPASAAEHIVASPTHKVTGNLTMRGKTLSISFPANIKFEDGKIMAKAKFNIDRTLWDLKYNDEAGVVNKAKDKFIYNTVNVGFNIVVETANL